MAHKYKGGTTDYCKYVDLPAREIYAIVSKESTELERSDLKAIIMELCTRLIYETNKG